MLSYTLMVLLAMTGGLLMFIILLQRGRGGGLAGAFGGAGGQSAFGTKAGDVFTKITVVIAVIWVILSGVSGFALRADANRASNLFRNEEAREEPGIEAPGGDADDDDAPTAITPGTTTPDTGATGTTASDSGAAGTTTSPEGAATPADTSGESSDDSSDGTDSTP